MRRTIIRISNFIKVLKMMVPVFWIHSPFPYVKTYVFSSNNLKDLEEIENGIVKALEQKKQADSKAKK